MHDSHVHIGQFFDLYISPQEVVNFLNKMNIDKIAVSSTSICIGEYKKVLSEMREIIQIAGDKIIPILWVIPSMLQDYGLEIFLQSEIFWRCLKIHPQLNPNEWDYKSKNLEKVISLAKSMNIPLLIHTGEIDGCYPLLFENTIADNPEVKFILAHGRPIDETIILLKKYKNVYCDTAFMEKGNIKKLCREQLCNRVLFGSDYPILKKYRPKIPLCFSYYRNIKSIQRVLSKVDCENVFCKNFEILFCN